MKVTSGRKKAEISFDSLLKDFISQHGTIFLAEYDDIVFIYKPLSRKDYKEIIGNDNLSDFQKEDEVCAMTVLWPEDIDWDDIDAGIPSKLYQEILKNSFLDEPDSVASLIEMYRQDLELLDIQMSCIISEAFPNYDIEDIESWDMIKFCKIFSRAEWKLKNIKSMDGIPDVTEILRSATDSNNTYEQQDNNVPSNTNIQEQQTYQTPSTSNNKIKVGSREMTADEYRQYQEFQRQFPEIDWGADAMFTGYESQTVSTVPVALR